MNDKTARKRYHVVIDLTDEERKLLDAKILRVVLRKTTFRQRLEWFANDQASMAIEDCDREQ